jgi:hypothetical protein
LATNHQKKNYNYTYKDLYLQYRRRQRAKGIKPKEIIDYKKYRAAMEHFLILVCRKIVRESFIFVLPYGLGNILLRATRRTINNAPINWAETKRIGKLVRFLCLHTFGYFYFTAWVRSHVNFNNKSVYRFHLISNAHADKKDTGRSLIPKYLKEVAEDPTKRSPLKY